MTYKQSGSYLAGSRGLTFQQEIVRDKFIVAQWTQRTTKHLKSPTSSSKCIINSTCCVMERTCDGDATTMQRCDDDATMR